MAEENETDEKRALAVELQGRMMVGIAVLTGVTLLVGLFIVFAPGAQHAVGEFKRAAMQSGRHDSTPPLAAEPEKAGAPSRQGSSEAEGQETVVEPQERHGEADLPEPEKGAGKTEYRTLLYDAKLRPAL